MPITNLPTFTAKQLLTAAQLNQIVTALQTKFSGNIAGADLVWPLVTDGDIDFGGSNGLLNLPKLWNIVNADEYDTLANAVAALPTNGGAIYIPGGTTVTADGVNVTGKSICIFGDGAASQLKLTGAASSGYLLRHSGTGSYRFDMYNLTVDGQGTGSAQDGIQLRQPLSAKIQGVTFRNFTGRGLWITNSGTPGFYADNVQVHQCLFEGGTLNQIEANDVVMLQVSQCQFDNGTLSGVYVVPTNSSYYGKYIQVENNIFTSCVNSIYIAGVGTSLNNQWGFINVTNNIVEGDTGDGITVGSTTAHNTKCQIRGNTVDAPGGDGILVNCHYGSVVDNIVYTATVNGIDLDQSQFIMCRNNQCRTAGAYGVDIGASTSCTIIDNDVGGCTTAGVGTGDTPSSPYIRGNKGDGTSEPMRGIVFDMGYSAGTGTASTSHTIPAKSVNSSLATWVIHVACEHTGGAGATFDLQLDDGGGAVSIGTVTLANNDKGVATYILNTDGATKTSYVTSPNGNGDGLSSLAINFENDINFELTVTCASGTCVVGQVVCQLYEQGSYDA